MDLLALARIHQAFCAAVDREDVSSLVRINHAFHDTIWQAARNRYLSLQLGDLRGQIEHLQTTTLADPTRQPETIVEHELILKAISDGDSDGAELAAKTHFQKAMALRLVMSRL